MVQNSISHYFAWHTNHRYVRHFRLIVHLPFLSFKSIQFKTFKIIFKRVCQIWNFVSSFRATVGQDWTTMPQYFKDNNFFTVGYGKLFHPGSPPENDYPTSWTNSSFNPYYWGNQVSSLHSDVLPPCLLACLLCCAHNRVIVPVRF